MVGKYENLIQKLNKIAWIVCCIIGLFVAVWGIVYLSNTLASCGGIQVCLDYYADVISGKSWMIISGFFAVGAGIMTKLTVCPRIAKQDYVKAKWSLLIWTVLGILVVTAYPYLPASILLLIQFLCIMMNK